MSSSFVWKSLTLAFSVLVVSSGCFVKAFDEQCRDPATGEIARTNECMGLTGKVSEYAFPASEPAESEKIKSIESRGNDIIFKFGDGSEKVLSPIRSIRREAISRSIKSNILIGSSLNVGFFHIWT